MVDQKIPARSDAQLGFAFEARAPRARVFTIAPSVPFLPTVIRALVDGTLVPGFPGSNDPLALAAALRRLAAADQRRPLAQAGRARAMQYFSDDAVAERTLAFWKELLGGT